VFNSQLQATTRKGPSASHLLKASIQRCVEILPRNPTLHVKSPSATPSSSGETML